MKFPVWMLTICLSLLVSCSGKKASQDVSSDSPQIEVSDGESIEATQSDEALVESLGTTEPSTEPSSEPSSEVAVEDTSNLNTEPTVQPESVASPTDSAPVVESMSSVSSGMEGEEKTYTVLKNETLMMIAFKIYGDYSKWREIAALNGDQLKGSYSLRNGMSLKYKAPAQEFVWSPEGNPYLIKTGDSLSLISGQVYGTIKKWRMIWDNNRPLIKDANKIFAGFTIYYLDQDKVATAE
jgi:nucleoid-associated protein YgaU